VVSSVKGYFDGDVKKERDQMNEELRAKLRERLSKMRIVFEDEV